jgi:riboflavin kinase / FMN adenylyltransferase
VIGSMTQPATPSASEPFLRLTAETSLPLLGSYVAIGNFDGVHRGHQAMIARLTDRARSAGRPAVAVTFDPHPLALLRPEVLPPGLTTLADRASLLRDCGVDLVVVLPTTWQLLRLTATEFFEQIVRGRLQATGLVEGPNFCFGRDRGGNVTLLRQLCTQAGLTLDVIEPVTIHEQWVSSSVIRSLLLAGDVDDAVDLLGRPYRLTGRVTAGARRGTGLGFPTANLEGVATVIPGPGVYAGRTEIEGATHAAAIHIGPNPTFGETAPKIEVHVIGYHGDLYDRPLSVDFLRRLRDTRRFDSADDLRQQLAADIAAAKSV